MDMRSLRGAAQHHRQYSPPSPGVRFRLRGPEYDEESHRHLAQLQQLSPLQLLLFHMPYLPLVKLSPTALRSEEYILLVDAENKVRQAICDEENLDRHRLLSIFFANAKFEIEQREFNRRARISEIQSVTFRNYEILLSECYDDLRIWQLVQAERAPRLAIECLWVNFSANCEVIAVEYQVYHLQQDGCADVWECPNHLACCPSMPSSLAPLLFSQSDLSTSPTPMPFGVSFGVSVLPPYERIYSAHIATIATNEPTSISSVCNEVYHRWVIQALEGRLFSSVIFPTFLAVEHTLKERELVEEQQMQRESIMVTEESYRCAVYQLTQVTSILHLQLDGIGQIDVDKILLNQKYVPFWNQDVFRTELVQHILAASSTHSANKPPYPLASSSEKARRNEIVSSEQLARASIWSSCYSGPQIEHLCNVEFASRSIISNDEDHNRIIASSRGLTISAAILEQFEEPSSRMCLHRLEKEYFYNIVTLQLSELSAERKAYEVSLGIARAEFLRQVVLSKEYLEQIESEEMDTIRKHYQISQPSSRVLKGR